MPTNSVPWMRRSVTHDGPATNARAPDAPHYFESIQALNFSHLLYFWAVARDGSIATACEKLHVSQPTISMQIRKLERTLGHPLFDRSGRSLVLTDVGRTVYEYADEMFSTGRELLGALRGLPGKRSRRLHVGLPVFLPKLIAHRLLAPVLHMPERVQLHCHIGEMSELVAGIARHKYDAILTDTPMPSTIGARTYSHPLGECDLAICGPPELAARYRPGFPDSLENCPMLLPTISSAMRRQLDRWFDDRPYSPHIVAEFEDSALMKEFSGSGLFPAPVAVLDDLQRQYGVELVGRLPEVRVGYYVVTTERKLTHPATVIIAERAKAGLLHEPDASVA
jgi:LysR family transcriptional activator of nhaA